MRTTRTPDRWGMKRAALVVALAAGLWPCAPCPRASAENLKIGFVNLARVFDEYQRTKDSEAGLEARGKQKQAQLEAQFNELKKLRQGLELLNDQAREAKAREIEEKSDQFKRTKSQSERELVGQRNQVAKAILDEIGQVVSEYAKTNGFSLVLDQRSLLYGQDAYDLTNEILSTLNERYAAKAKKAPAKP